MHLRSEPIQHVKKQICLKVCLMSSYMFPCIQIISYNILHQNRPRTLFIVLCRNIASKSNSIIIIIIIILDCNHITSLFVRNWCKIGNLWSLYFYTTTIKLIQLHDSIVMDSPCISYITLHTNK